MINDSIINHRQSSIAVDSIIIYTEIHIFFLKLRSINRHLSQIIAKYYKVSRIIELKE